MKFSEVCVMAGMARLGVQSEGKQGLLLSQVFRRRECGLGGDSTQLELCTPDAVLLMGALGKEEVDAGH